MTKTKPAFLYVKKGEHSYMFRYLKGNEKNLFLAMIEYAKEDEFNISIIETMHLIRKISAALRENPDEKRFVFTLR